MPGIKYRFRDGQYTDSDSFSKQLLSAECLLNQLGVSEITTGSKSNAAFIQQ